MILEARVLSRTVLEARPWRKGKKLGRRIYVQMGKSPNEADPLLGIMETETLAELVVTSHNKGLR